MKPKPKQQDLSIIPTEPPPHPPRDSQEIRIEVINVSFVETTLIDTEGQSVREAQDDDHVVELAMSISKHGLLEPIVVRPKQDGRFQLIAGFHRLAAYHRLQRPSIPAHIYTNTEPSTKTLALVENIIRRDLTLDEQVTAVNHLHHQENLSPSQICDLLGKSRAWVDQRLAIPNLPEDIREELLNNRIAIKHAEILARISDQPTRSYLLNATIQQKLSSRNLDDLAKTFLETPSIQDAIDAGTEAQKQILNAPPSTKTCHLCGAERTLDQIVYQPICHPSCLPNLLKQIKEEKED